MQSSYSVQVIEIEAKGTRLAFLLHPSETMTCCEDESSIWISEIPGIRPLMVDELCCVK